MVQQSIYSGKSGGHAETDRCSIAFNTLDSLPDHFTGGIDVSIRTWSLRALDMYYPSSLGFIHNLKALLKKDRHVRLAEGGSEGTIWPCQVTHADDKVVVELPHHYYEPIQAFTWREKAIRLVLRFKKKGEVQVEEPLVENLTMILAYMNRVFVQVVVEAKKVKRTDRTLDWRSPTFDNYLLIEYFVRRHEPAQVRNYRRNNDHNINRASIAEVDWVRHEHTLGEMWYGSRTQFEMDEKMKTVDVARKLIDVMVDFYDPVEDEDPDFGYTYKEHLQGSAADKGKGKVQGEGDDSIGGGHRSGGVRSKGKGRDKGKRRAGGTVNERRASQRLKDKHKHKSPMPSPSGSDRSSMDV
ncbi:hypothetical protein BKA82DRAFT_4011275 [Pisolithus tinctorius]|nr:hypothetical protein BKA82DRAFT_4011275 [Pisolithus tinctorius]